MIARFKLLSVGRLLPHTVIYAIEHSKGQQPAVSSTFRVLTQAQHQTRAVAAKKSPQGRCLKFYLPQASDFALGLGLED